MVAISSEKGQAMEHCKQCRRAHHSKSFKKDLSNRLNRIAGQVQGVKAMIEQDVYCDDVLNQITGIRAALSAVQRKLLEGHITSCVLEQLREGDDTVMAELMETIRRMVR